MLSNLSIAGKNWFRLTSSQLWKKSGFNITTLHQFSLSSTSQLLLINVAFGIMFSKVCFYYFHPLYTQPSFQSYCRFGKVPYLREPV